MDKDTVCVHYRECIGQCDSFGKGCSNRELRRSAYSSCRKKGAIYKPKNSGFRTLLTSHLEGDYGR